MISRFLLAAGCCWVLLAGVPAKSAASTSVLTYHNDNDRTGWNAAETVLTTANVNASSFGLLNTVWVDGRIDAQPLVVPAQAIDGAGVHDVVYVATSNDSVYAIDAYSGAILQTRNLGVSIPYSAKDGSEAVYPASGILSTPVIDRSNNAIYVVTDTNEGASASDVFRLHKLALNNFSDLVPSQVLWPTTTLADGSTSVFAPQHIYQRPGLLEANGNIYVAFGSSGDNAPTLVRGVIACYSASNLAPAYDLTVDRLRETTNPFYLNAIWQSGYAPAADAQGNVYFSTSNSDPNTPSYNASYNFPESVLKVSGDLSHVLDSFTISNYFVMDQGDGDLGAGGVMLLPDQPGTYPHLVVAGGKDGRAFILNRDGLGGYTSGGPNHDLAELAAGGCWCGPAYFVGADSVARIVTGGANGVTTWRVNDGSTPSFALEGQVAAGLTNGQPDNGGTIPSVSSNGTTAGSAIVWIVQRPNDVHNTMYLRAFDAANLSHQLFSAVGGNWSNQYSNANAVPVVANGYVYVGSYKQLRIFGPLSGFSLSAPAAAITQGGSGTDSVSIIGANGFNAPVTLSASNVPSGVSASFSTNPATSSSVLTLTAGSTVAPGTYTITVNGVSGSLSASTSVTLTVGAALACHVVYTVKQAWTGAFVANLLLENTGQTAFSGWTITWPFTNGQTVTTAFNGSVVQNGSNVAFSNASNNASIGAGGSWLLGFVATWNNVTNTVPTSFAVNGTPCT